LAGVPAPALGSSVIQGLLNRAKLSPDAIDEVILGQVLAAGSGQNPARQASITAGLPHTCPAMTINKVCGSGLKAVHLAAQAVKCDDAQLLIAGGQENMSSSVHLLPKSRDGQRMGDWKMQDSMIVDGLCGSYSREHCREVRYQSGATR
jgi:acetyl-CoA C-acetyltransferase